jgi:hypothetical protein
MSHISDKKIIEWIKSKAYSKLTFLEDHWLSSENEWYLGFYYFMQDFKQGDLQHIFSVIVSRLDDRSSAYCYLGNTAEKIFNSIDTHHIPACFYRKAIEFNEENSDAHWGLYHISRDMVFCLKSFKLDYECGNFDKLNYKIDNLYPNPNTMSELSREDWLLIKRILLDVRASCHQNMLISAHFYLSEFDEGIALIDAANKVNIAILQPYIDQTLISKNELLSKIYDWQVNEFLDGDHKQSYQECVKEFKKGNLNPTRTVLIHRAFRAEAFQDLVIYYDDAPLDDVLLLHDLNSHLYYLLAQSYLNQELNKKVLGYISEKTEPLEKESNALYQALKFKQKTEKLEKMLVEGSHFDCEIDYLSTYQEALKTIDNSDLLNHFLYEQLNNELKLLKSEWDKSYYQFQFVEMKTRLSNGNIDNDDFLTLCNFGIKCGDYNYVLKEIFEFHNHNKPTMSSYNCIGVCYERKNEFKTAFEQYKCALDLMHSSKEHNHVIISNYINCAKKVPEVEIVQNELIKLKEEFNTALVNNFKWHTFITKGGNKLFKYSPFNINTIDSLTNQYFYLAEKIQLNDPIELSILDNTGSEELIDSNYRICSFSNNNNSMLMWSHYAHEHQGIMVEYWFGGDLPDGFGIEKISYSDDIKRNTEKELYIFNQYILTKNKEWSYENEVRLFSNRNKVSFDTFAYPNHDRNKINARICSITLGCKFPKDKKMLITNIITSINRNKAPYEPRIIIKEAFISSDNRFSLEYREIGAF